MKLTIILGIVIIFTFCDLIKNENTHRLLAIMLTQLNISDRWDCVFHTIDLPEFEVVK